ncbi:Stf0 family sulfotransferase [Oricola sp.]|uniref:Stf0 family sulfotransferase n=1 Tax=Oricola sp. TaxID=1979950 RepID=UPI003BAB522C
MTRLDIPDLAGPQYDRADLPLTAGIYICTTPRTASFTLCRYLVAQGWGVPTEYYMAFTAHYLMWRWQIAMRAADEDAAYAAYGRALMQYRVVNGIFASKLMAEQLPLFRQVHPGGFDGGIRNIFVHLRRGDLAAQVASLVTAAASNRWSFSDVEPPYLVMDLRFDRESVDWACRYVVECERLWSRFFREREITPLRVRTRTLVEDPRTVVDAIAERLALPVDEDALAVTIDQERNGEYGSTRAGKERVLREFGAVIETHQPAYAAASGNEVAA